MGAQVWRRDGTPTFGAAPETSQTTTLPPAKQQQQQQPATTSQQPQPKLVRGGPAGPRPPPAPQQPQCKQQNGPTKPSGVAAVQQSSGAQGAPPGPSRSHPHQPVPGAAVAGPRRRPQEGTPPPTAPPLKRAKIDNTAANLEAKQREAAAAMEELRRKIKQAEEEEARKKAKLQAEQEARETAARQQAEKQRRTEQLRKGFGSLAASAPAIPLGSDSGQATSSTAQEGDQQQQQQQPKAGPSVADATEIARVLESKNDYQCLRLHVGATMAHVNKAYKALSLMLHPDKCPLEGAHQAWQRVKQARDNLARQSG